MLPSPLALLLLILGVGSALGPKPAAAVAPEGSGAALQRWLQDSDARRGFLQLWRGRRSPLAAALDAYNAYNASASASGNERVTWNFLDVQCAFDVYSMQNSRSLWALKMLDASVKKPSGLLVGAWTHMGNWDECVGVRDVQSSYLQRTFHGQMCMVKLRAEADGQQQTASMQLSLGMCLPSSCSPEDVRKLMAVLMESQSVVEGVKLVPSVSEDDCTTRDAPYLDSADVIAVMVLSALAMVVVLSTVYDVTTPAAGKRPLSAAFSLVANGRKLLALPRPDADHSLSCLHGLRFLSMCWIILLHRYQNSSGAPSLNPQFRYDLYQDFWHLYYSHATLAVDTFFVLTGLLMAYLFFKQDASKQRLNIPLYYLHRYIRITPPLAMMVLLTATLLYRTGWGPMWTSNMGGMRDVCREYWWKNLLYVSNYVKPLQQCVDQSWYLNVDMQLHWVSPLLLLPLVRMPKVGLAWLLFLCLGGIVSNFLILHLQDLHPSSALAAIMDYAFILKNMKNYYYPTHTRFVPYVVGLLVGYLLAVRKRTGQDRPLSLPRSIVAWLVVTVLLLGNFLIYYCILTEPSPPKAVVSLYTSVERPAWGAGVALLVYLCAVGNGGPVNAVLSWWGFHILGRLSYSAYLVHMALMKTGLGASKILLYLGDAELLTQFCGDLVATLVFAALLSVVCESPFVTVERELVSALRRRWSGKGSEGSEGREGAAAAEVAVVVTEPVAAITTAADDSTINPCLEPAVDSPPETSDSSTDTHDKAREIV